MTKKQSFLFKSLLIICFLFTTSLAKSQCCSYTLSMHDSYGDGWNGGYLDVYINNVFHGTYSGLNFANTDTFQICNGDSLKLIYTAGAYENENSYQLYDPAWNLIHAEGSNPAIGVELLTTGNCQSLSVPGNNPCTAIPIDTGQCVMYDNTGFPHSGLIAGCANNTGPEMWFSVIVPPSGNLNIATDNGSLGDTGLAIWTDTTCTNIHAIACDDDSGPGYFSLINLYDLTPGQQLYIQVWGYNGQVGTFQLCVHNAEKVKIDSTRLPLILINTLGNTVTQGTKVNAMMYIKYNGAGTFTHITDSANVYSGNIGINKHGASSSGYPQIPYAIETRDTMGLNHNVSLLGMPSENDWLLTSNYNDRSMIRNTLAHKIFTEMGNYSPREQLCVVLVDSVYQGIYVFGEKIKQDLNRVNIATLTAFDLTGNELTGGYILQQNLWNSSNSFQSNYSPIDHPGFDVHYLYQYPSSDSIKPAQKTYIASFIDSLETALYSANFVDSATGYRQFLDTKSFIDYFLVNELSRNNDGFKKSVFFNKDKFSNGGKFKAGPVWDFDWAWKDLGGCSIFNNSNGSGWAHHINDCGPDNYSNGYYIRLLQDTIFDNELRCRYETYRNTVLDTAYISHYIDSMKNYVAFDQAMHFQKWPILGTSGPAPEINAIATTYNAEMDTLKAWIKTRIAWLDANIPGHCYPQPIDHTGINEETNGSLNFYPNPSAGTIHFEGTINATSVSEMKIYDITGKEIDRMELKAGLLKFDYQLDRKGVFYFSITGKNGKIQYGKLIVL